MSEPLDIDLGARHGETTLSNYEVFMVGQSVLNWLTATMRLGHASPASLLDYTTNAEALGLFGLVMRDFVAWTSGRTHLADGCEARMREWVANAELDHDAVRRMAGDAA